MDPMYLPGVENNPNAGGYYADVIQMMRAHGATVPQIMHMLAYKPEATKHLNQFTHAVMRGSSPLAPGMRELIAAFTSRGNHCLF
jgi:alkylhydroperoxidase family enzyme